MADLIFLYKIRIKQYNLYIFLYLKVGFIIMIERSRRDPSAVKSVGLAALVLALMISFTLYRWYDIGFFDRMRLEMYAEFIFVGLLVVRCVPTYTYELKPKNLIVVKKGILRTHVYEIPYRNIFNLYRYAPSLAGSYVKFRRTLRMNSALDGREVWTLAYTMPTKKGKENCKMYLKMDEEFLRALNNRLPANVKLQD